MSWESKTELVLDHCMNAFGVGENGTFTYVMDPDTDQETETECRGIFDNAFVAVDPDTKAVVQMTKPILGIKLSDLSREPRRADHVIVKGIRYTIEHVEKDVHGGASLHLHLYE